MSEQTLYTYTDESLKASIGFIMLLLLARAKKEPAPDETASDFFDEVMPVIKAFGTIPPEKLK